ncbi:MAG: right-handed parallel beta-helix repeat-containing protein, partial [Ginsengibacter sp.]
MKKLLLLPFILFGLAASATDYYISSSNGNDLNNGVTPSTAWKTINKLNSFSSSLKGGDRILLKRGDKFYGKIQIIRGGTIASPIVIGDFGAGEKPILSGFSNVTQWTSKGSNIWESTTEVSSLISLNMVVINGQNTAMGRFPNSGFFTYQSHSGKGQITSSSLTGGLNWAGAEIAIFITSYGLNRGKIISQPGNTINFSYNDLQENIQRDNQGFFIQNDERTLDLQNEWYYNSNTKKLKLYSTYEPVNIQVSAIEALIEVQDISNVIVQNIYFEGSNSASVLLKNAQNISLRNCGFNYSGINAIHGPFWGNSAGLIIDNCSFDHSNNTAIALQAEFGNSTITNNTIRNTGVIPGMGAPAGDFSYTGLYSGIHATGSGSLIENNVINNSAYTGITFAGSNTLVRNNFIDTACTFLHDGAGIYTWNGSGEKNGGMKIMNNIVLNVVEDCGIYTDDRSNGIEISGNSVANCYTGFYFHNNWDLLIQGNTSFNNTYSGVNIYNDDPSVTMSNNIMKNNLFVGNSPIQRAAFFYPMEKVVNGFSILDNNYYAVPIKDTYTIDGCLNGTWGRKTLDEWKVTSGKEANSKKSPKTISQSDYLKFEYNATSSPQNKILDARYVDLSGNIFNGSVNLLPFTSVVLIRDGELINNPPTANAGANVSITLPTNTATLNGSGLDSDGTISSYKWVKISGPG